MLIIVIFAVLVMLLLEGICTGGEIAFLGADKAKVKQDGKNGNTKALQALYYLENIEKLLQITLVGSSVSIITNTAIITIYISRYSNLSNVELYSTLIVAPLVLIFGELVPKNICRNYANFLIYKLVTCFEIIRYLLFPFIYLIDFYTNYLSKFIKTPISHKRAMISRRELKLFLKEKGKLSDITHYEHFFADRILKLADLKVDDIKMPLINVVCLDIEDNVNEVKKEVIEEGYSKIPVYKDRIDNIVGIVELKDILVSENVEIKTILKSALYVPFSQKVLSLLKSMQAELHKMAVVVDEYGGATGIVTMEDIVEEVVGDILDEFDEGDLRYRAVGLKTYIIDPQLPLEELSEDLGINLEPGDYETVAGFILNKLGYIPKVGTKLEEPDCTIEVIKADKKRIKLVKIEKC